MRLSALLALLIFASTSMAQPSSTAPASKPTPGPAQASVSAAITPPQASPAQVSEVAVLKAQLATMQEYHDSLLSTVYWSLGSILAALLLFVGYGWYSNKKINDKELELLISRLKGDMDDWVTAADNRVNDSLEASAQKISEKVAEEAKKSVIDLQSQIKRLRVHHREIKDALLLHQAETEVRYWVSQNVPANVLRSLMNVLRAIKGNSDYDWKIDITLEHMTTLLRADRRVMDAPERSDCLELISSLPPRHEINVAALKSALSA